MFTRTNIQRHMGEWWWSRQKWPLNASLGSDCFQKHYLAAYCGQPIPLYETLIKDALEIQQKNWAGGRDDRSFLSWIWIQGRINHELLCVGGMMDGWIQELDNVTETLQFWRFHAIYSMHSLVARLVLVSVIPMVNWCCVRCKRRPCTILINYCGLKPGVLFPASSMCCRWGCLHLASFMLSLWTIPCDFPTTKQVTKASDMGSKRTESMNPH